MSVETMARRVALPLLALLVAAASWLPANDAAAGGFYLMARGTRPLGRGGAFVAGADDPGALWYNPAGLAYSGNQILLDGTLGYFTVDYTRVDSGGNTLPTVTGQNLPIPIPTAALSYDFGLENFNFGLGVMAPNAALMDWPDDMGTPQRYSLLSLEGSLLAAAFVGVSWRPIPELSIGGAVGVLPGSFRAVVALSACDGVLCTYPEDPKYDAVSEVVLPFIQPVSSFGAILDLDVVRVGISVMTPFALEGQANLRVRPPSAAAFSGAEVVNRRPGCDYEDPNAPCRNETVADVNIGFPWVLRAGVEVRPMPELRIETAVVWETWSMQDAVRITPQDVWIEGALGFLDYEVGPIVIPRNMQDTVSVRLGGAYTIDEVFTIRLGGYYESSSFQDPYLSVLTVDSDKVLASGGISWRAEEHIWLEATAGFLWLASHNVTDSRVPQVNPIRPDGEQVFVGNGQYEMRAPFVGLGLRWMPWGRPDRRTAEETEEEPEIGAEPTPETSPGPAQGSEAGAAAASDPEEDATQGQSTEDPSSPDTGTEDSSAPPAQGEAQGE